MGDNHATLKNLVICCDEIIPGVAITQPYRSANFAKNVSVRSFDCRIGRRVRFGGGIGFTGSAAGRIAVYGGSIEDWSSSGSTPRRTVQWEVGRGYGYR